MSPNIKAPLKTVSFLHDGSTEVADIEDKVVLKFPNSNIPLLTLPIHNALFIVGLFLYGLPKDPRGILRKNLVTYIVVQLSYGYLVTIACSNKKKKDRQEDNRALLIAASMAISLLLSLPVFIALVLFGAPLIEYLEETYLLGLYLSLLAIYPLLIQFKCNYETLVHFFGNENALRVVSQNHVAMSSVGYAVGTWIGVIPLPLDWDRDWQRWPITLLTGGMVGSFLGSLIPLFLDGCRRLTSQPRSKKELKTSAND